MPEHTPPNEQQPNVVRRLRQSRSLWLAFVLSIAGVAVWAYAAATAPKPMPAGPQGGSAAAGLVAGFASGPDSSVGAAPAPVEPRLVDRIAPALVRLGPSFMAGFFLAWAVRKSIKMIVLAAGAAALLFVVLRQVHLAEVDWSTVESHVSEGLEWTKAHADEWSGTVKSYIPSGGAAAIGMFFGARFR